jgi:hypothetical protein
MTNRSYTAGDRVRHTRRPEWGVGSVLKAEGASVNGRHCQRLSVRFSHAGLKTISTAHTELELVTDEIPGNNQAPAAPGRDRLDQDQWLAPLARRKLQEKLTSLSPEARDPFHPLRKRLAIGLDLYRFQKTGRSLIDWAIAQTGLDDPLSEFSRQELEQLFDRWMSERDGHLQRLLTEARAEPQLLQEILAASPPDAAEAVRRLTADR